MNNTPNENAVSTIQRATLLAPVQTLDGVSESTASVLATLHIATIFDLATSPHFKVAQSLQWAATGSPTNVLVAGWAPWHAVDSQYRTWTSEKLVEKSPAIFRGISSNIAEEISEHLGIENVREMGLWSPYLAASEILGEQFGNESVWQDEGTPPDLLPGALDLPTDVNYYRSAVVLEADGNQSLMALTGAIDVTAPPTTLTDIRYGALLTFEQTWTRLGLVLGQLLHSTALAPGESTKIAVVDWIRRERGTQRTSDDQQESLTASTYQGRAHHEVTSAVANEIQVGASTTYGTSATVEEGMAAGGFFGGGVVGFSGGAAATVTSAISGSFSSGHRSVAGQVSQQVNESTQQNSASSRSRRSAVVTEVSQFESETATTRTVTNYNHTRALTIQYHEVLQAYRTDLAVTSVERLVFLPVSIMDFADPTVLRRFRTTLQAAAIDRLTASLLAGSEDVVEVTYVGVRPFQKDLTWSGLPTDDERESLKARAKARAKANAAHRMNVNSLRLTGSEYDETSDTYRIPATASLLGLTTDPGIKVVVQAILRNGSTQILTTTPLNTPISIESVEGLQVGTTETAAANELRKVRLLIVWPSGRESTLLLDHIQKKGVGISDLLVFDHQATSPELIARLQAHALHYSKAVWASIGRDDWAALLGDKTINGIPLLEAIDARPVAINGTSLGFRWIHESFGISDKNWSDFEQIQNDYSPPSELVMLPTGGVFGEAVLGRALSAEKLDLTRFWNWQDSPIPFAAPDIAPVSMGSRAGTTDVTGPGFAEALVTLQELGTLPDATGLNSVLQTVGLSSLFRDMSGMAGTTDLAKSLGALSAEGAAHAATQAGSNMATAAQAQLELLKTVLPLIAAAAGIPLPTGLGAPGTGNISNAGAAFNAGAALDASSGAPSGASVAGAAGSSRLTTGGQRAGRGIGTEGSNSARAFDAIIGTGDSAGGDESTATGFAGDTATGAVANTTVSSSQVDWLPQLSTSPFPAPGKVSLTPGTTSLEHVRQQQNTHQILERAAVLGTNPDQQEVAQALTVWWDKAIEPLLVWARTEDLYATTAIKQALEWWEAVQTLGVGQNSAITDRLGRLNTQLPLLIKDAVVQTSARMALTGNPDYLIDLMNWVSMAKTLGIEDPGLTLNNVIEASPLHIRLGPLVLPDPFTVGAEDELEFEATLAVGNHAPLRDRYVRVNLEVNGGTATPSSGGSGSTGTFRTSIKRTETSEFTVTSNAAWSQRGIDLVTASTTISLPAIQ